MDAVFHFHFYDPNNQFRPMRSLAFYVANLNTTWDELDERIAYCAEDMEKKYGEHCGLMSNGVNTIGFASSQIHEGTQQDQLMQLWRTIFVQKNPGCVVGDVIDAMHVSDAMIFERTKDAHEQQQAEQLRATLSSHVSATRSATIKKI